jgi:hypothetical protein
MGCDMSGGEICQMLLSYPRSPGHASVIGLDLEDVRSSDGIRISYDFERDGWVIAQARAECASIIAYMAKS